MKKVAVIHTSLAIHRSVDDALRTQIPDVEIHNIIDELMLNDVVKNNGVTPDIIARMCKYVDIAADMGVDAILNACSSVGEAFDVARKQTAIPTVRIDEPMAEDAVAKGDRIALYGTVATTLLPSSRLIERIAREKGKQVEVTPYLIDGAFEVLSVEKNVEKHNQMVLDEIMRTQSRHDVIVLAQASMAVLMPKLKNLTQPVMYSLVSGTERVRKVLER